MRWRLRGRPSVRSGGGVVLAARMERVLVALAVQAAQLDHRLERLERRVDDTVDDGLGHATYDDLLELRIHAAKVAADLARVTVELRAEIERRTTPTSRDRRAQTLAETIIDLSDSLDTRPDDGWAATA
jgi:hypothetical protein